MAEHLMEWMPFKLRPTVNEQVLLAASDVFQREFLSAQSGFIRRELLRAADGSYVDLVWWNSVEAATAAMTSAAGSRCCTTYFALISDAGPNARLQIFDSIAKYTAVKQYFSSVSRFITKARDAL
jgi:hypothetical protein